MSTKKILKSSSHQPNAHTLVSCVQSILSKYECENLGKSTNHVKKKYYVKEKDYITKRIPLSTEDLLEFSISRTHCPMVVRHKKQICKKLSKSHSQPLRIQQSSSLTQTKNRFKISLARKISFLKQNNPNTKSIGYYGTCFCNLFKFNSKRLRVVEKNNKADKCICHSQNNKRNSKTKGRFKHTHSICETKNVKRAYPSEEVKKVENLKTYESTEPTTKPRRIQFEDSCRCQDCYRRYMTNQKVSKKLISTRGYSAQSASHAAENMQKNNGYMDLKMIEKNQLLGGKYSTILYKPKDNSKTVEKIYQPEHSMLENFISSHNIFENVVELDVSQSQFCKISTFLKNNTSKCQINNSEVHDLSVQKKISNKSARDSKGKKVGLKGLHNITKEVDYSRVKQHKLHDDSSGCDLFASLAQDKCSNTKANCVIRKICQCSKCLGTGHEENVNSDSYCWDSHLNTNISQVCNNSDITNTNSDLERKRVLPSISEKVLTISKSSDTEVPISKAKNVNNVAVQTDRYLAMDVSGITRMTGHVSTHCHSHGDVLKSHIGTPPKPKKLQSNTFIITKSSTRENVINYLEYDMNMFNDRFSQHQIKEYRIQKKLYPVHGNLQEPFATPNQVSNFFKSNLNTYKAFYYGTTTVSIDSESKYSTLEKHNSLECQKKTTSSSFVSPIFPGLSGNNSLYQSLLLILKCPKINEKKQFYQWRTQFWETQKVRLTSLSFLMLK
ncbi:uncharacterized protein LOC128983648 isoform X2 [Macrosteles quadrilineatus]|uniref:uncharacterized protein LOC128983648 isoform X2 n=1 Tax=Macrosteles quadrilineatus TaxID=74068 RepID=UPI0023E1DC02|nr:uncharacterized protein LOC128983648 isoform X2 [Macrosteles quadrilineatus]